MSEVEKDLQQMKISEGHGWKIHQVRTGGSENGEYQSELMS